MHLFHEILSSKEQGEAQRMHWAAGVNVFEVGVTWALKSFTLWLSADYGGRYMYTASTFGWRHCRADGSKP